ncbi:four helix bundle protein [Chryseobacterium fluminis]|nr:four helix bundle protein [Chryseobacterium sp. MMS21-Ot14]UZT97876.1 four helix bundle protein [Chryseobacterium sp. MMS21-Ot14]
MHHFEKLIFWQKSIELAKEVYIICADLPKDEKFGLISQIIIFNPFHRLS